MFSELLESKAKRERRAGGAVVSTVAHAVIIVFAVVATASGKVGPKEKPQVEVVYVAKTVEPAPKTPPPPSTPAAPTVPVTGPWTRTLTTIVDIPTEIPPIDLSAPVTNPDDFGRAGTAIGANVHVDASGTGSGGSGDVFEANTVEKTVLTVPGSPQPRYPQVLLDAHVEGEVLAQFIVDTTGRVEAGSLQVLRSSHDLFTASLKNALPQMRFLPAEVGGRKVRQLVQQPFQFHLSR